MHPIKIAFLTGIVANCPLMSYEQGSYMLFNIEEAPEAVSEHGHIGIPAQSFASAASHAGSADEASNKRSEFEFGVTPLPGQDQDYSFGSEFQIENPDLGSDSESRFGTTPEILQGSSFGGF